MAFPWLTALKLIPWRDVVENAPTVLRTAKRLWDQQGRPPPPAKSLEQELAALREESRRAAQVIESLAEQNTRLIQAVEILRVRTRVLVYALSALAAGVVALLVLVLAR